MPLPAIVGLGPKLCLSNLGRLSFHSSRVAYAKLASKTKTSDSTMEGSSRSRYRPSGNTHRQHQSRKQKAAPAKPAPLPVVAGPPLNNDALAALHGVTLDTLRKEDVNNPKVTLTKWTEHTNTHLPSFSISRVSIDGTVFERASLTITVEGSETQLIVATGDALTKKEAERQCSLSAVMQLYAAGQLEFLYYVPKAVDDISEITLQDGTTIDYDRAKQFMDYYCRRFGFEQPAIVYDTRNGRGDSGPWDAILSVNGRRIGLGTGKTKRTALSHAFLDVTQYLHSCDPDLWNAFVDAARTGRDLGLAPRLSLMMGDEIGNEIRDLTRFLRGSKLYSNRPSEEGFVSEAPSSDSTRRSRPPPSSHFHDGKSRRLVEDRETYRTKDSLAAIRAQRESLPVFTQATALLETLENNEVTICMAATGSGKTTQIPQIILDHWIAQGRGSRCNILCTQPRRLAAISVANRVAAERGEQTGQSVGYQVRFESNMPDMHGCITFCTTGVFLRRMQSALDALQGSSAQQNMDDITHIIVDEAHERDVDTDLTLMVLKRLLDDRRARKIPIKVVLMSATIDPTLFQRYFADQSGNLAPLVEIPGRSYPVEKHFLDDFWPELAAYKQTSPWAFREPSVVKYLDRELGIVNATGSRRPGFSSTSAPSSIQSSPQINGQDPDAAQERQDDDLEIPYPLVTLTIAHVLRNSDDGHVLVFLPGWEEIQTVQRMLVDPQKPHPGINFKDETKYELITLHSSVPLAEQQRVFDKPREGIRRIILSTNVAETSVTIPNVVYVVDTARVKELRFEPERHMSSLVSAWVGASNLNQRAGRAGRHRAGEYYGVLSSQRAAALQPYQTVEMLRTDLSNVVMHVKALNFPGLDVEDVLASTIEPPDPERVEAAMVHLRMVGALDSKKQLTSLGRVLLQLPIETSVGRLLLFGALFRCLDRALSLAAILTNRDPFLTPILQKREAQARKDGWATTDARSDPLTILRAYEQWATYHNSSQWNTANQFCFDNFLSKPTLLMIHKIRGHLLQSMYTSGVIDVAMGRVSPAVSVPQGMRRSESAVPIELNENHDSVSLLTALIAVASQPKFAVRTGTRTFRTQREKNVVIHASSVNHASREDRDAVPFGIYTFGEKRQNLTLGDKSQMSLMSTTKIDPLIYVLFGAFDVRPAENMLECDEWVPITGYVPQLQEVGRLKYLIESCMLRVYEGILEARKIQTQAKRQQPSTMVGEQAEEEWGDEGIGKTLSQDESLELSLLCRQLVGVLNHFGLNSNSRAASRAGSRMGSRPATPSDSMSYDQRNGRLRPARSDYPSYRSAVGY